MMTNWTPKEHKAKGQPYAGARGVICLGLGSSSVNTFGGRLGQETSIDSRQIRH